MAFSTVRGRPPRARALDNDPGTPELRMKHALGITAEPIDLCLARRLITADHHWCALHLRWLYTLRYGAPVLSTRYTDRIEGTAPPIDDETWRIEREREYHAAIHELQRTHSYEPVMRISVYNEHPAFLNPSLQQRAWNNQPLANQLLQSHHRLRAGLDRLVIHWQRGKYSPSGNQIR